MATVDLWLCVGVALVSNNGNSGFVVVCCGVLVSNKGNCGFVVMCCGALVSSL